MSPRRSWRPVENVFLPGDKEIYEDYLKGQRKHKHDDFIYKQLRNKMMNEPEEKIQAILRELRIYLKQLDDDGKQ